MLGTKPKLADGTVHKLPDDMKKAILADKKMLAMWEDITPLARNEWICWTTTVAKPETRTKHIVVMRDKMHKGERRPCCWLGCPHRTDKSISPSVQSVLDKRKSR
jgi:uncharacterized protein YdeI (YjbR/CyaY-like superfamily)